MASNDRLAWRIADRSMIIITAVGVAFLGTLFIGSLIGFQFIVIETGSMRPTIQPGGIVIDKQVPASSAHPGQIITFRDVFLRNQLVTHRVVKMVQDGNVIHFTTKGDANNAPEHWLLPKKGTIGRVETIIPTSGRWVTYLQTLTGKLVVIWVLAIWLIAVGLRHIWRKPLPKAPKKLKTYGGHSPGTGPEMSSPDRQPLTIR